MLTRLIAGSSGFGRLALTKDDELDAALALAGLIDLPLEQRYCFQTTYLNECFLDYRGLQSHQRLIWVVRNPYSVVYSMLYNWRRFALNELYESCGIQGGSSPRTYRSRLTWPLGPSRLEKACLAYRGKVAQILAVRELLQPDQLLVVDYDALVASPGHCLPRVFRFAEASYDATIASAVQRSSAHKADRLSHEARRQIEQLTWPTYRECVALARSTGEA